MAILDTIIRAIGSAFSAKAPPTIPVPVEALLIESSEERTWVDDSPISYRPDDAYTEQVLRSVISDLESRGTDSRAAAILLGSLRSTLPPRRGTRELLAAYRYMPHLRSVVGRVASSVSSVPWKVYKIPRGKELKTSKAALFTRSAREDVAAMRAKVIKEAVDVGDLVEAPNHLLSIMLNRPNPEQTGVVLRKTAQIHMELVGEAFFLRESNGMGVPVELWGIPPHWVKDVPRPGNDFFEIQFNGARFKVPSDDVWWVKDTDAERPYERGSGIAAALSDELDVDEFAAKHMKSWFANHAIPSALVGIKGAGDEEVKKAGEDWREKNRGPFRNNRVHFHNGELTFNRLDDNFKDMEIIDVRKYEAQITRETWNVPPEVLGHVENSKLATIKEALNILGILTVVPRLEMWSAEINEVLTRWYPDGDRLIVVYENPIRPNMKEILEAAKSAPEAPSVNDWRAWMNLPPVNGGEEIHIVAGRFQKWDPNGSPLPALPPAPPAPQTPPAKKKTIPFNRSTKAIDQTVIDEIADAATTNVISEETGKVMEQVIESFAIEALRSVGLGASFNMTNPAVIAWLAEYGGDKITEINTTTKTAIRLELLQGVAAGEGIGPLSRRVREVFDEATAVRSRLIARTEVVGASNFARLEAFTVMGDDLIKAKRWLTTIDGRQRSTHAKLNGQLQPLDQPFVSSSGAKAQHPGGFGKASEDCNCRCTFLPILELDDEGQEKTPITAEQEVSIWRAYDREIALWEGAVREAWVKVFARQQAAVLRILERLA